MKLSIGDIVVSTAGRDKNAYYLVIGINETRVLLVNGKNAFTDKPKSKNFKHIKKVFGASLKDTALKINGGQPTGKEKLFRAILEAVQKNRRI